MSYSKEHVHLKIYMFHCYWVKYFMCEVCGGAQSYGCFFVLSSVCPINDQK